MKDIIVETDFSKMIKNLNSEDLIMLENEYRNNKNMHEEILGTINRHLQEIDREFKNR